MAKNNFKFSPQSLQELSYEARGIAENEVRVCAGVGRCGFTSEPERWRKRAVGRRATGRRYADFVGRLATNGSQLVAVAEIERQNK